MSVLATKLAEWNTLSDTILAEHQPGSFEQCAVDNQALPCEAKRAATALALAVIALERLTDPDKAYARTLKDDRCQKIGRHYGCLC